MLKNANALYHDIKNELNKLDIIQNVNIKSKSILF